MCFTAAANVTLTLCEWDTSVREVSSKISEFTDLKQFDRINSARINCGTPLVVGDHYEWICFTAVANVILTLCEWDTSFREVRNKLPRVMTLKKVDHIVERGKRYQTKGKFGGIGGENSSILTTLTTELKTSVTWNDWSTAQAPL